MGISEKVVVGFVIKNDKNDFLFQYEISGKTLDVGLLDREVTSAEFSKEKVAELFLEHTGHDITEAGEIYTLDNTRTRDCIYKIYYLRANWSDVKSNNYMWLSKQDIEHWYEEGRINNDQMALIKKAGMINFDTLTRKRINKPKNNESRKPSSQHISIIQRRIHAGRLIKPTDKSQEIVVEEVIRSGKHGSIKNFPNILNYEELLIKFAKMSPNPLECSDYFYQYINDYIKDKKSFREELW